MITWYMNNPRKLRLLATAVLLLLGLLVSACSLLPGAATPTSEVISTIAVTEPVTPPTDTAPPPPPTSEPYPPPESGATAETPSTEAPTAEPPSAPWDGLQVAFLKDRDLVIANWPGGALSQITLGANLFSFAWSPDGQSLATFNGLHLCILGRDGSQSTPCVELGLDERQSQIERRIVWSPDQSRIVMWNPVNPWDEGAIGWLIVPLDGSEIFRIEDPVDWGLALAPNNEAGGITGQPAFLADSTLVGTMTHRWLCGSGGCHYQLFSFDFERRSFTPYPNQADAGWSEGQFLVLNRERSAVINFGTFFEECQTFVTFMDIFDLNTQARQTFNLGGEAVNALALTPDGKKAVIARTTVCAPQTPSWASACGLTTGAEVLPMQTWDLTTDQRNDLPPGIMPGISPDGAWLTFNSCMVQNASGGWEGTGNGPPGIFIMNLANEVFPVSDGVAPAWRP